MFPPHPQTYCSTQRSILSFKFCFFLIYFSFLQYLSQLLSFLSSKSIFRVHLASTIILSQPLKVIQPLTTSLSSHPLTLIFTSPLTFKYLVLHPSTPVLSRPLSLAFHNQSVIIPPATTQCSDTWLWASETRRTESPGEAVTLPDLGVTSLRTSDVPLDTLQWIMVLFR